MKLAPECAPRILSLLHSRQGPVHHSRAGVGRKHERERVVRIAAAHESVPLVQVPVGLRSIAQIDLAAGLDHSVIVIPTDQIALVSLAYVWVVGSVPREVVRIVLIRIK